MYYLYIKFSTFSGYYDDQYTNNQQYRPHHNYLLSAPSIAEDSAGGSPYSPGLDSAGSVGTDNSSHYNSLPRAGGHSILKNGSLGKSVIVIWKYRFCGAP